MQEVRPVGGDDLLSKRSNIGEVGLRHQKGGKRKGKEAVGDGGQETITWI